MNHQDRLAGFHRTVSNQLNARLAESPRFFWALVLVSTGYGYVLWNAKSAPAQAQPETHILLLASFLSYIAVLWANWYLAALGYAFRFLQNCQHCIEHALRWEPYTPKGHARKPGEPPMKIGLRNMLDVFWLLPGIYHAHLFGLCSFLAIIIVAFCWSWWQNGYAIRIGVISFIFGFAFIVFFNWHYLRRFRQTRRDPSTAGTLEG